MSGMLQGEDKGSGLRKGRRERKTLGLGCGGTSIQYTSSSPKPWGILSRAYGQDAKTKVQLPQTLEFGTYHLNLNP